MKLLNYNDRLQINFWTQTNAKKGSKWPQKLKSNKTENKSYSKIAEKVQKGPERFQKQKIMKKSENKKCYKMKVINLYEQIKLNLNSTLIQLKLNLNSTAMTNHAQPQLNFSLISTSAPTQP